MVPTRFVLSVAIFGIETFYPAAASLDKVWDRAASVHSAACIVFNLHAVLTWFREGKHRAP